MNNPNNIATIWGRFVNYFKRQCYFNPQDLIDSSNDSIIIINDQNTIEAFNLLAEYEFGYFKDEVIGWPIDVLFEESVNSKTRLTIGDLNRISLERALKAMRKDGSVFTIDLILTQISFNSRSYYLAIIRNITDRRALEEMKEKQLLLEAEANAKSDYISILSHELRTPVASIQGALGLLAVNPETSKKNQELFKIAYRNTERLGKIINILLDLDELRDGKRIELTDTVLIPVIKEAISISKCVAEEKAISLIEKYPPHDIHILSNQDKLIQVCINLLSNAIRSSPIGESVTISLDIFPDKVRVSIEDRGDGVPEHFIPKLFSPFAQADKSDTKKDGLGLGLHLSQKIIDLLGGTIGFTTIAGKGSIFYFELPLAAVQGNANAIQMPMTEKGKVS